MTILSMTCEEGIKVLSDSAGRALGAVLHWVKSYVAVGYKTFTQLYKSSLCPILDAVQRSSVIASKQNVMQSRMGLCAVFRVYKNLQYVTICDRREVP